MRKKSHISLARYLVYDMQIPTMMNHKTAFYIGNVLPDCKPSFLTQRHEFGETYEMVKEQIYQLSNDSDLARYRSRVYMRRLGEVVHYLADYFTFPHNVTYAGTLKEHCIYEKHLKNYLKKYVHREDVFCGMTDYEEFSNVEEIFSFVQNAHDNYLSKERNVEEDSYYIVFVSYCVVQAILNLVQKGLDTGFSCELCAG